MGEAGGKYYRCALFFVSIYKRFHRQEMAEDARRRKEAGQLVFDMQENPQAQ
jgi:hypothetical protein